MPPFLLCDSTGAATGHDVYQGDRLGAVTDRVTATTAEILLALEPVSAVSSYGQWSPGYKGRLPSLFT